MSQFDLWIEPEVYDARQRLPGNFRQQIKRIIDDLATNPRPTQSRPLDVTEIDVPV